MALENHYATLRSQRAEQTFTLVEGRQAVHRSPLLDWAVHKQECAAGGITSGFGMQWPIVLGGPSWFCEIALG